MDEKQFILLRRIYVEICRGYSHFFSKKNEYFIKHLNAETRLLIDDFYLEEFNESVKRGIKPEKDKLAWLQEKKLWTEKDEVQLQKDKDYVKRLYDTKRKVFATVQIKSIQEQIDAGEKKILGLEKKRSILIGLCAEESALRKTQYAYLSHLFFKDKNLKEKSFSQEEIENMDDNEISFLLTLYNSISESFNHINIKKIALQPFFTNPFYLCHENLGQFFGRSMTDLSEYQLSLLTYGSYYKNITSNHQIPLDIQDDPEKIEDFVNRSNSLKKTVDRISTDGKTQQIGLFGVSDQDFKDLNIKNNTDNMRQMADKGYKNAMEIVASK